VEGVIRVAPRPASAAAVLSAAERTNDRLGHENRGSLSAAGGFVPSRPPRTELPQSHAAWDQAAAQLPQLVADLQVRSALELMPVLPADPSALPDWALLRAATVLGVLGHTWVHMTTTPDDRLPVSVARPWAEVRRRLQRRPDPVLSYADLVVNNWQVADPECSPALRVHNLRLLVPSAGNQEEQVFYLTQLEILARSAPVVAAVAEAQQATAGRDLDRLGAALDVVQHTLEDVTRRSLSLIDPRPRSSTFVQPVVWAKTVAPLAVPFRPGVLGPSGTASPLFNLLDVFFGRTGHGSQLGREILAHRWDYPPHWQEFLSAVAGSRLDLAIPPSAGRVMAEHFEAARQAYVGPEGFLERHRRKVYGYLTVAFTVGRGVTIGGFSGSPRHRRWIDVDTALTTSRQERAGAPALARTGTTNQPGAALQGPSASKTRARGVAVSELVEHNATDPGWWVAVEGRVLDVSGFLARHPGGAQIIQAHAGLDATDAFRRAHGSRAGSALRNAVEVGVLQLPPSDSAAARHRDWLRAAFALVELQNALRLDRSFGQGTDVCDPDGQPASALQLDRALDTWARFANGYLPNLVTEVLQPLSGDGSAAFTEWTGASDGVPGPIPPIAGGPPSRMATDAARRLLDDLERRVAALKSWAQEALRDHETLSCQVTTAQRALGR